MLILGMLGSRHATVTGGTLYSDATWYYRVFTSGGNFTVTNNSINVEALVIAGGGGGGDGPFATGGGGGAGGLRFASMTLPSATYPVVVGAGGAINANGGDSSFNSITSTGGGHGCGSPYGPAGNGGSGGGAANDGRTGNNIAGTGIVGQGFDGGGAGDYQSGGGGAGQVGQLGVVGSHAGNGGNGVSTYSSWGIPTGIGQNIGGVYWLAGGGGGGGRGGPDAHYYGGAGGKGGGATGGSYYSVPIAPIANTGSGGAGAPTGTVQPATAGASGVVIIRYRRAAVGG